MFTKEKVKVMRQCYCMIEIQEATTFFLPGQNQAPLRADFKLIHEKCNQHGLSPNTIIPTPFLQ